MTGGVYHLEQMFAGVDDIPFMEIPYTIGSMWAPKRPLTVTEGSGTLR